MLLACVVREPPKTFSRDEAQKFDAMDLSLSLNEIVKKVASKGAQCLVYVKKGDLTGEATANNSPQR